MVQQVLDLRWTPTPLGRRQTSGPQPAELPTRREPEPGGPGHVVTQVGGGP